MAAFLLAPFSTPTWASQQVAHSGTNTSSGCSGTATARLSGSIRYSCSGSIGGSSGEGL